ISTSWTPARYLPADCLVYVQFKDLSTQIKNWQTSALSRRYYDSKSYELWARRHFSLKLAQRLEEFQSSLGGSLTLEALRQTAGRESAIGVYDIGETQFVFLSKLGRTGLVAKTMLSPENFEEKSFNGQSYYIGTGGDRFQISYAVIEDHLIIASKERLLLDTMISFSKNSPIENLEKSPQFQTLMKDAAPLHDITIWLNQERVNKDWYFRHYWIHKNFAEIVPIKAAVLDLEMGQSSWTERRIILTDNKDTSTVSRAEVYNLVSDIPASTVAFQVQALNNQNTPATLIDKMLFDSEREAGKVKIDSIALASDYSYRFEAFNEGVIYRTSDYENQDQTYDDYYSYRSDDDSYYHTKLDGSFSVDIDDSVAGDQNKNDQVAFWKKQFDERREIILRSLKAGIGDAKPKAFVKFGDQVFDPKDPKEIFVSSENGLIFLLESAEKLNRAEFEKALKQMLYFKIVSSTVEMKLDWTEKQIGGAKLRALVFPLTGRGIAYAVKGNKLILANYSPYAEKILMASLRPETDNASDRITSEVVSSYRVVKPKLGKAAFLKIFNQLDSDMAKAEAKSEGSSEANAVDTEANEKAGENDTKEKIKETFFSGNLASLFDVIKNVKEVTFETTLYKSEIKETITYRFEAGSKKSRK
ncbi:MAG: hypothetical protein JNN15_04090, partial [Blastocatellia bacterium]|nr:hypothetical protein [Blastocatellia bacterium]